jgi:dephospho-CoA kinase
MASECTRSKKTVIGLTGPIGAGKTTVANLLGEFGCAVIHADELAHRILEEDGTKSFLIASFGPGVIGADGRVDRAHVAAAVFGDREKIRRLEEYIHPEVIRRQEALVARLQEDPAVRVIVLDVPLLIESGLKRRCDWVILVDADLPVRQRRVREYRGWSTDELARREKFFFSIYLKRSVADAIVYNNSTIDACRQQVEMIYSRIISSVPCQFA